MAYLHLFRIIMLKSSYFRAVFISTGSLIVCGNDFFPLDGRIFN